jgi:hypothetical protein
MTQDKLAAQSLSGGPVEFGAPLLALAPTLSDLLQACREPKHRELAHVLATIIALHDVGQTIEQFQSDDTVPVARASELDRASLGAAGIMVCGGQ